MTLNTEEISEAPIKPAKAKRQPIAGILLDPGCLSNQEYAAKGDRRG